MDFVVGKKRRECLYRSREGEREKYLRLVNETKEINMVCGKRNRRRCERNSNRIVVAQARNATMGKNCILSHQTQFKDRIKKRRMRATKKMRTNNENSFCEANQKRLNGYWAATASTPQTTTTSSMMKSERKHENMLDLLHCSVSPSLHTPSHSRLYFIR